ncbi:winged helix-turn-helix transcriptional regulator [Natronosalvus halobius]|uniref:winged helix-turn-helix transcriptional regulator n=1 Tax=Natronosalvus halobius TaxID=2953746 RepID=UPI0020A1A486|nr:helix-turn-helix domain-containing protein [Natronosalvus halobius]USZ71399.1 helix-turn-helix domain-containing protein [Natronosalvus halobius]
MLSISPSTVTSIIFLAGHSHSRSADLLEHDVRKEVYETVHQTSGIYVGDLRETHDLHRSTLRYHLDVLEQAELLASETVFGKVWYYPAGSDTNQLRAAFIHEPTGDILEAIARLEPVSVTDLANEVDRTDSTVSHHLDRLEEKGLIEQERRNTTVLSRLVPEARAELETVSDPGQWTEQ